MQDLCALIIVWPKEMNARHIRGINCCSVQHDTAQQLLTQARNMNKGKKERRYAQLICCKFVNYNCKMNSKWMQKRKGKEVLHFYTWNVYGSMFASFCACVLYWCVQACEIAIENSAQSHNFYSLLEHNCVHNLLPHCCENNNQCRGTTTTSRHSGNRNDDDNNNNNNYIQSRTMCMCART